MVRVIRYKRNALSLVVTIAVLLGALASSPGSSPKLSNATKETVDDAYSLMLNTFYRPIEKGTLERGAVSGIVRYERSHHKPSTADERVPGSGAVYVERLIAQSSAKTGLPQKEVAYAAIAGMAGSAHDRWTVFLTPKDLQEFSAPLNPPSIFGIGALVDIDRKTRYAKTLFVIPHGPADGAGLQTGDLITSIDGVSTKGLAQRQVTGRLRGVRGSTVHVWAKAPSSTARELTIVRNAVRTPTVFFNVIPNTSVGYIYVSAFGRPTAAEFTEALRRLDGRITSLVLDLRDDGGGYVQAAVSVASHFVQSGPIVSSITRDGSVVTLASDDERPEVDVPTAVLVNGYTASASEIAAGALQDTSAAVLVGSRTFGKGVEQTLSYLPDGSAIKITTARYLTPNNHDVNGIGLQPDRSCAAATKAQRLGSNADPQLRCALSFLKRRAPPK